MLSIGSWVYFYFQGLTIAYNDSMSHLNMARLVIDNINPGFAQLGGVWLPLPHILTLALVWNDWAWHTGLAASVFSMLAYIFSAIGIYFIVKKMTLDKVAAFIGAAAFALNLNVLYLQATPLTETLYVCFFIFSVLVYLLYIKFDNAKYLLILGFFGFLQVLTRYDGWFVVGVEGLLVISNEWFIKRRKLSEIIGKTVIFGMPVAFGIGLWFFWNLLIFKDLFFFATGAYSAHAQQAAIAEKSKLTTKLDLGTSLLTYWFASVDNVGIIVTLTGFLGASYYLITRKFSSSYVKLLITVLILTPIIFNILALFLGFSVMSIPELSKDIPELSKHWFNVRYGILALPFFTIFTGVLASWKKPLKYVVVLLLVLQVFLLGSHSLITVEDGTIGTSAFVNQDVSKVLKENVQPQDEVLLSIAYFNAVTFSSQKDLHQFIHEGTGPIWNQALKNPENYAEWVVVSRGDTGDVVYTDTLKEHAAQFSHFYKVFYTGEHAFIFKRRTEAELPIYRDGALLKKGDQEFKVIGVNSYDLAFQSDDQIRASFVQLHEAGVNTIRFWLFNDGEADGFQTQSGTFNEQAFLKADLIFSLANHYSIQLIPVLANNWADYGGIPQYMAWTGKSKTASTELFYTDTAMRNLYKNYLNYVLTRHNTITGTVYAEDNSVLSWDLINEPRSNDLVALQSWTNEMAQYVREKDKTHLIMLGTEQTDSTANEYPKMLCNLSLIDICSTHLYLYKEGVLSFKSYDGVQAAMIQQQAAISKLNKPLLMEEFGVSKATHPFGLEPLNALQKIVGTANELHYNGYLVWNWSQRADDSFGFSPNGTANQFTLGQLKQTLQ